MTRQVALMKCGCVALAHDENAKPVCPIHAGISPGAYEVEENPPKLTGRMARCTYCRSERPSDYSLPFFTVGAWKQGELIDDHDSFYCGCRGWD